MGQLTLATSARAPFLRRAFDWWLAQGAARIGTSSGSLCPDNGNRIHSDALFAADPTGRRETRFHRSRGVPIGPGNCRLFAPKLPALTFAALVRQGSLVPHSRSESKRGVFK